MPIRKRPEGPQYKHLVLIRGRIHYRRQGREQRLCVDTGCRTWSEAVQWKRAFEARAEAEGTLRRGRAAPGAVPCFAEVARLHLERPSRLGRLSESTVQGKKSLLRPDGHVMLAFAERPVDSISVRDLEDWWSREIVDRGRSVSHGRNALNAVSRVIQHAMAEGWARENPAPAFRAVLRETLKTKAGRAEAEGRCNPIERAEDVARLVEAAREEDLRSYVAVLLLLDTGMRLAEAEALTWGQIVFGTGPRDLSRHIVIDRARVVRDYTARPKSGRVRRVQLSSRLRAALLQLRQSRFNPGPEERVLHGFHGGNFRAREWRRILDRAGLGHWSLKDLRDTFASHLLTLGINPAYVAKQLGHADWSVTARHYARWTAGDLYVEPERLAPGEVPSDLIARYSAETPSEESDEADPDGELVRAASG